MPEPIDLLIEAKWIIPVEPTETVLENHSVAVDKGRIVAVLQQSEGKFHFTPRETIKLHDHILIPGLVNLHTHAAMSLLKGLADDLPLDVWLREHIWPAEEKHVSAEFVYDGTLLACVEMLRGGVTCFNDMYFFPRETAKAAAELGMRAVVGLIATDFPSTYAADIDDYLAKGLAVRDEFRDTPLTTFCLAPHAPYTVGDRSFEKVLTLAEQCEIPIHTHLHETRKEIDDSMRLFGMRPIERLRRLGLLGPGLIGVHAVYLEDHEMQLHRALPHVQSEACQRYCPGRANAPERLECWLWHGWIGQQQPPRYAPGNAYGIASGQGRERPGRRYRRSPGAAHGYAE